MLNIQTITRIGRGFFAHVNRRVSHLFETPETPMSADDRAATWNAWIDEIYDDVMLLRGHQQKWQVLARVAETNTQIPPPNYVMFWLTEVYGVFMAVGIRRQAERANDVVTLARLIDDIARHPEVATRERYEANGGFAALGQPGQPQVDPQLVRNDLGKLRSIAASISRYVNQHIAHMAETGGAPAPTIAEIHAALEEFARLVQRYLLFLTGGGTMTIPVLQYDFLGPLEVAWAPPDIRDRLHE